MSSQPLLSGSPVMPGDVGVMDQFDVALRRESENFQSMQRPALTIGKFAFAFPPGNVGPLPSSTASSGAGAAVYGTGSASTSWDAKAPSAAFSCSPSTVGGNAQSSPLSHTTSARHRDPAVARWSSGAAASDTSASNGRSASGCMHPLTPSQQRSEGAPPTPTADEELRLTIRNGIASAFLKHTGAPVFTLTTAEVDELLETFYQSGAMRSPQQGPAVAVNSISTGAFSIGAVAAQQQHNPSPRQLEGRQTVEAEVVWAAGRETQSESARPDKPLDAFAHHRASSTTASGSTTRPNSGTGLSTPTNGSVLYGTPRNHLGSTSGNTSVGLSASPASSSAPHQQLSSGAPSTVAAPRHLTSVQRPTGRIIRDRTVLPARPAALRSQNIAAPPPSAVAAVNSSRASNSHQRRNLKSASSAFSECSTTAVSECSTNADVSSEQSQQTNTTIS